MTDIIKRIDAHLESDNAEQRWLNSDNLLEEAQAEIERLLKIIIRALNDYEQSSYPDQMDFDWIDDVRRVVCPPTDELE